MPEGPYSRVYHRIQDEFPEVFDDEVVLGTWLRLLVMAEASYPSQAHLPRKVRPKPLATLVDAGLVSLLPGERFRIKGLDQERQRRSEQGRKGGQASSERRTNVQRTSSERTTSVEPRQDETSKDKTRPPISPMNGEEKPFVTLSEEEKEKRRQADRDELMSRTMARLGVKP